MAWTGRSDITSPSWQASKSGQTDGVETFRYVTNAIAREKEIKHWRRKKDGPGGGLVEAGVVQIPPPRSASE